MSYTNGLDKPSDYFNTKLYTGNGSTGHAITGVGHQPDLTWIKSRDNTEWHILIDSVRGVTKYINSNDTGVERTSSNFIESFDSNGFTLGPSNDTNQNSINYASWNWKAGTSFTNDASATGIGTIDSTGSVNQDAGFSIVSYTGTGSNATVGHGLGVAPNVVICKSRTAAQGWESYFSALGATQTIRLDSTAAAQSASNRWNNTAPTSTVFSLGTEVAVNGSSANLIAYCFAEKKGYSKFGSYTGNGSTNGTFVYTGFKSAWVMIKRSSASGTSWEIRDNKRQPFPDGNAKRLFADDASAESSNNEAIEKLSNGFKIRSTGGGHNTSGATYIYMAFAENPFVTSTGVPSTAK
jgi:hypothetical protein